MRLNARILGAAIAGAIAGAASTYISLKKHYERKYVEYCTEVHDAYTTLLRERDQQPVEGMQCETAVEEATEPEITVPVTKIQAPDLAATFVPQDGYYDYSKCASTVVIPAPPATNVVVPGIEPEIHTITIDEYGEIPTYSKTTLIYHPNGELTEDGTDELVENWEGTVGHEWLNTIVNGLADTVYIRNSRLKIDYEIVAETDID